MRAHAFCCRLGFGFGVWDFVHFGNRYFEQVPFIEREGPDAVLNSFLLHMKWARVMNEAMQTLDGFLNNLH